jgi:hypothetical protein
VRRKPTPGLTWSGCAFAMSRILTIGRISLRPVQPFSSPSVPESNRAVRTQGSGFLGPKRERGTVPGSPSQVFVVNAVAVSRGPCQGAHRKSGVWSFDDHIHARRSNNSSRWHTSFILLCTANINP